MNDNISYYFFDILPRTLLVDVWIDSRLMT